MKYAYLGPKGTFSEAALRTIATPADELIPARSISEALDAVWSESADAALVPLENSVGGAVAVTMDELLVGGLMITREVLFPVTFDYVGEPHPVQVAAHPQASAQCRIWLRRHMPDAVVVDMLSNAAAAQAVADGVMSAAITAPLSVREYGLSALHTNIGDRPASTRFVLVKPLGEPDPPTGNDLTSLAVYIRHDEVGALMRVLSVLADWGINLTRIESRPTGEALGRYVFLLDCEGHIAESPLLDAREGLSRFCTAEFLGSYPNGGR